MSLLSRGFEFYYKLKGCRCGERLRAKAGGGESLSHTRWNGDRGYLRREKGIRGERSVSGRGECVRVKLYEVFALHAR